MSREEPRQVDVVGVDHVDDDEPAELALAGPLHHARRDHLEPGLGVDDDRGGLDGVERADRLADEVRESGRVDQVDARFRRIDVQDRRAQRVLPGLLQRIEIGGGRAALDAAGRAHHASASEQRLGERRLAGRPVAHQRYGTKLTRPVFRHARLPRYVTVVRREFTLRVRSPTATRRAGTRKCCGASSFARGGVDEKVAATGRPVPETPRAGVLPARVSKRCASAARPRSAPPQAGAATPSISRRLRNSSSSWYGLPR